MHLDDLETGEQAEQPEQATRPAADVSRDPTPGVPDHALPDDE